MLASTEKTKNSETILVESSQKQIPQTTPKQKEVTCRDFLERITTQKTLREPSRAQEILDTILSHLRLRRSLGNSRPLVVRSHLALQKCAVGKKLCNHLAPARNFPPTKSSLRAFSLYRQHPTLKRDREVVLAAARIVRDGE